MLLTLEDKIASPSSSKVITYIVTILAKKLLKELRVAAGCFSRAKLDLLQPF